MKYHAAKGVVFWFELIVRGKALIIQAESQCSCSSLGCLPHPDDEIFHTYLSVYANYEDTISKRI